MVHSTGIVCALELFEPGAVARSDQCPPGMRTVAGSLLTSGNILSWRLVT